MISINMVGTTNKKANGMADMLPTKFSSMNVPKLTSNHASTMKADIYIITTIDLNNQKSISFHSIQIVSYVLGVTGAICRGFDGLVKAFLWASTNAVNVGGMIRSTGSPFTSNLVLSTSSHLDVFPLSL